MQGWRWLFILMGCLLSLPSAWAQGDLFPFVVPWDGAPSGAADMSVLLHRPAGKFGHVRLGTDGHFYVGAQRIRFWGMNMSADNCFLYKSDAPKVALRLAKAGINVVRFHHMDADWSSVSLIDYKSGTSRRLNPEALDLFDYLFAQMKRVGIYANINLLVQRRFFASDGLPVDIESLSNVKDQHVVGCFYQPLIDLQKEYARQLLTHRNSYTGLTYAQDPAVAFVEINNENGLVHGFLDGVVDRIPALFQQDLQRQWNEWLLARYGNTANLRQAWGERSEPFGPELITNGSYTNGTTGWYLEQYGSAQASATVVTDAPIGYTRSVRIQVTRTASPGWYVQWSQSGLRVVGNGVYTLSFWAKASTDRNFTVGVQMAHAPWAGLSPWISVPLTTTWRRYEYTFVIGQDDDNARVLFSDMALQTGSYWITGVSFRRGGDLRFIPVDQSLEARNVSIILRRNWGDWNMPDAARKDWLRFLRDTEERYWNEMYRYLKQDLGVRALVTGTVIGCALPSTMASTDFIDKHHYWQHPVLPAGYWDPRNWYIYNIPMVNYRDNTITGLAPSRILGKPLTLSEYNHPAPNTYCSEGLILIAAYALLQDWDAVYVYTYTHRRHLLDARMIVNPFDVDQHPTHWMSLVAGAAMFLRGDVAPAQQLVGVTLSREQEIEHLRESWAWRLVDGEHVGLRGDIAFKHRVAVALEGQPLPPDTLRPDQVDTSGNVITSDTGQLRWDWSVPNRGVFTLSAPRSKAVVGFGAGRQFDLGDGVVVEPGNTRQNGFSVITLTVKQGAFSAQVTQQTQVLITATGYVQNTDWGWEELGDNRVTVRENWGRAPSLVEGIPARITLPLPASAVQVYALDERGGRKARVSVGRDSTGRAVFEIGAQYRTLWYEVVASARDPSRPERRWSACRQHNNDLQMLRRKHLIGGDCFSTSCFAITRSDIYRVIARERSDRSNLPRYLCNRASSKSILDWRCISPA